MAVINIAAVTVVIRNELMMRKSPSFLPEGPGSELRIEVTERTIG